MKSGDLVTLKDDIYPNSLYVADVMLFLTHNPPEKWGGLFTSNILCSDGILLTIITSDLKIIHEAEQR